MIDKDNTVSSVTIIAVCFNSSQIVGNMLASVPAGIPAVLVDNGSEDIAKTRETAAAYEAYLIVNSENLGFGVACNMGAAEAKSEFLFFLNPDVILAEGAIEALVSAAIRYRDAVAFKPAILDSSGRPRMKHSSVLLPRNKWMPPGWPDRDCEVPVLSGAALFVRREAFERVGGFDPNIFLYHEDDDLSLRLGERSEKLMFIRDAIVVHTGGRSSTRSPEIARLKAWHMGRSRMYASRKHGRPWAFPRALGLAILQSLSPMTIFSKRKRAKQLAFLRGIWNSRK